PSIPPNLRRPLPHDPQPRRQLPNIPNIHSAARRRTASGPRPRAAVVVAAVVSGEGGCDGLEEIRIRAIRDAAELSVQLAHAESFTKLLSFNQTEYQRVLLLDSDSTVLKPMDELFLLPSTPLAMPRAYWLNPQAGDRVQMSAQLLLIEPSAFEFSRIQKAFESTGKNDYDMEIVNDLYKDDCMVIPHRKYNLLTGEFKGVNHSRYLGNLEERWNATKVLGEAKFLHFSDWPFPKPWLKVTDYLRKDVQPKCHKIEGSDVEDCLDRELWNGFYTDFAKRRKDVCDLDLSTSRRKVKRDPLLAGDVWR
ncbi:hypothetical protein RUND412_011202, partial [Rhizina undulata]